MFDIQVKRYFKCSLVKFDSYLS